MAGQLKYDSTNTTAIKSADPKLTKAYAEGRIAQIAGGGSNPHAAGSDANEAWQEGYDTVVVEGTVDSCAECIPITVPNVVGDSPAVATAAIIDANLMVGSVTHPLGEVAAQTPTAGTKVQRNTVVSLTVTPPVEVPDVVGMDEAAATIAIEGAGLELGTVTLDGGVVTAQSPLAGTMVQPGTDVDITLTTATVPDVVGMDEAAAEAAIILAGFILGTVTLTTSPVAIQDPAAGVQALPGTAIDITLTE